MSEDKRIDLTAAAALLGVPERTLRRAERHGELAPQPTSTADGGPNGDGRWERADVLRWAAGPGSMPRRVRVRYWPAADRPATYIGAHITREAAVQVWETTIGTVAVAWPFPDRSKPSPGEVRHLVPDADTLVCLARDFGHDGPALDTATIEGPEAKEWADFGVRWRALSRVLGQPLPYWPYLMREPELIQQWQPGQPAVIHPVRPDLDTAVLLRTASTVADGSPVNQVLVALARETQARQTRSTVQDLDILQEHEQRSAEAASSTAQRLEWPATVVAAEPLAVVDSDLDEIPEQTSRLAWLELLNRADTLASACVRELLTWNGGRDWPFSGNETIDPATALGGEFAARLTGTPRTAAFELLDWHGEGGETLVDPETYAPVIRTPDGKLTAAVPQWLPTISPLAEVILEGPIWARSQDGRLYLFPQPASYGISWGYGGGGPHMLAKLIDALLHNPTTAAGQMLATIDQPPPAGLMALVARKWPQGTVLSRQQLVDARTSDPGPDLGLDE